jgi:hypothetical protein
MANWEKLNKEFDDAMAQFDKWADYKLRLADVSGQLPMCEHDYKQEDQYWYKCTKCGATNKPQRKRTASSGYAATFTYSEFILLLV